MSWRQPLAAAARISHRDTEMQSGVRRAARGSAAPTKRGTTPLCLRACVALSVRNGRHLARLERLEKPARLLQVELRILRFDAEEEPIPAGEREPRHVEDRVIRHRQAV